MARAATRTANVFTRVDPETKEQAEAILNQLGIPMSNAIGMFLKQIVMQRGIPFEMSDVLLPHDELICTHNCVTICQQAINEMTANKSRSSSD